MYKFKFDINYSVDDYYKMNNISFTKDLKYNIIIYILLYFIAVTLCHYLTNNYTTLGVIILLPVLFYLINKINVQSNYNRVRLIGAILFYNDYFELKSGDGIIRHEYSECFEVTETSNDIYLCMKNDQTFKLKKSDKFIEFIKDKVPYRRYY